MARCQSPPPPPPALSSQPCDIDLIKILQARVGSGAMPAGNNSLTIHEADVYAQDPAALILFEPAVSQDGQKAWYFFSPLTPKSQQRGKRIKRCSGSGVWHDEGKSKPVVTVDGGEARTIGHHSLFAFREMVNGRKGPRTGWIMKEFRLDDGNEGKLVLCKVYTSSRHVPNPAMGNEAEAAEAHVQAVEGPPAQAVVQAEEATTLEGLVKAWIKVVVEREKEVAAKEKEVAAREKDVKAAENVFEAKEVWIKAVALREKEVAAREKEVSAREKAAENVFQAKEAWIKAVTLREKEVAVREKEVSAREKAAENVFQAKEAWIKAVALREKEVAAREKEVSAREKAAENVFQAKEAWIKAVTLREKVAAAREKEVMAGENVFQAKEAEVAPVQVQETEEESVSTGLAEEAAEVQTEEEAMLGMWEEWEECEEEDMRRICRPPHLLSSSAAAAPAPSFRRRRPCSLAQPRPPLLLPAAVARLCSRPGAPLQSTRGDEPPSHDEPRRGQVDDGSWTAELVQLKLMTNPSHFPDGIDPKNACKIEIDVTSFRTVEDGQSVYHKGRVLEWWVDSEEYSIIDMEKDVLQYYCWASNQEANFWYDRDNGEMVRLPTDQELLALLQASKIVKFIMTVDRSEMNVCDDNLEIVHEMNELQIDPRIESEMQIIVRDEDPLVEAIDLEWAEEPQHGVTTAGPERVEEEEKEHYMDPGFDAEGDDPLGADEEWRYFKKKASG
ncbi:hypothetical protein EJB05_29831, partial [Eragrostis curvula]